MRPWVVALAVLAGCGADAEPRAAATAPVASAEHRFTVRLPDGWDLAPESLTPKLTNPVEIVTAGTAVSGLRAHDSSCAQLPVAALEALGPTDAFVTVQERLGEGAFAERPARFALTGRVVLGAATCVHDEAELEEHWFEFRDAGRGFHVLVALGPEAPPERREEALALLDSLRFEPGPQGVDLDPDTTLRFEDAGARLAWQMPVPPWRRYDWPLTSVQGERLLLGTFPLELAPPDGNCTPRQAIEAMPDDGAFIYLFEYVDLAERWLERIPDRPPQLEPGPEVPYECMGESRMVTWKEGGRAFQAHVYVGPLASDALARDARSILNSIQVR